MKTIIAGSRTIEDQSLIYKAVKSSGFEVSEVVSGGQKTLHHGGYYYGTDYFGEQYAKVFGIPIKIFYADWLRSGRSAGPIRNQQMADYADALIAIWDGESRGTKDMIDRATKRGLKVFVYDASRTNPS